MGFELGDRVRYLARISDGQVTHLVPGNDEGTVIAVDQEDEWGRLYTVQWDNAPYGQTSPFTGQVYTLNPYPEEYLIPAEVK